MVSSMPPCGSPARATEPAQSLEDSAYLESVVYGAPPPKTGLSPLAPPGYAPIMDSPPSPVKKFVQRPRRHAECEITKEDLRSKLGRFGLVVDEEYLLGLPFFHSEIVTDFLKHTIQAPPPLGSGETKYRPTKQEQLSKRKRGTTKAELVRQLGIPLSEDYIQWASVSTLIEAINLQAFGIRLSEEYLRARSLEDLRRELSEVQIRRYKQIFMLPQ